MQSFEAYRRDKLARKEFRQLYARECHVCPHTVRIFERMLTDGRSPKQLAAEAGEALSAIIALMDAEYCDPGLTVRLCRHLGLAAPSDCPRRTTPPQPHRVP